MKLLWKLLKWALVLVLLCAGLVWLCDFAVSSSASEHCYSSISDIPHNRVGVLLGTSSKKTDGSRNPYFYNRINAAVELFKAGKIDFILVSGDNGSKYYNEPEVMKNALVAEGIPADRIYQDFAGFSTLDSVLRARDVFGLDGFTVISQRFHNERAVYLAERNGIRAIAYDAEDLTGMSSFKTDLREKFARVKMYIDLALGTQPVYLGEKITIE